MCIKCGCLDKVTVELLKDHLFINGFDTSYTRWIWHGESAIENRSVNSKDRIEDVIKGKKSNVMRVIN